MRREQVYEEIKGMFGIVPTFLKQLPDETLETEWHTMRRLQFEDGPIPPKYRQLIGLGISAVTKCHYCTLFHTEAAKFFGATPQEIENAVHTAKDTAGWSAYVNGLQINFDEFTNEVHRMLEYAQSHHAAAV